MIKTHRNFAGRTEGGILVGMNDKDLVEKGKIGEVALGRWLDQQGLAYLYIDQSETTFARLFLRHVKRPDFLMLFEGVGLLAVDAKNCSLYKDQHFSLKIDAEIKRTIAFERLFRLPVWYAYMSPSEEGLWYWINALKVLEVGENKVNGETGEPFFSIDIRHFLEIRTNEDLGKLYTQRLPDTSKVGGFGLENL